MPDTVRSGMISGLLPPPVQPADVDLDHPADDRYRIRLAGDDRTYYLPAEAPAFQLWALRYARNTIRPVYVEATGDVIDTVRLPLVGRIRRLVRDADGHTRAALDSSAPWLTLPDGPGGDALAGAFGTALRSGGIIMVTTGDDHKVLQAVAAPVEAWYLAPRFVLQASPSVDDIPASVVPMTRIDEAFAIVKGHRCGVAPPTSCVPFDFPDTGCEARAQEMCRILAVRRAVIRREVPYTQVLVHGQDEAPALHGNVTHGCVMALPAVRPSGRSRGRFPARTWPCGSRA